MSNLYLLAPAANMSFASLPSGSSYVSDENGLVVVSNGSAADYAALAAAGCAPMFAIAVGATQATLAGLYAADVTTPYAQGAYALVFADGTGTNDGLWQKTGTGNGSGNWTQIASYTVATLQSQVNAATSNVTTLQSQMTTANANIAANTSNIATNANLIANETTARIAGDATNAANIANETSRAESAETALGTSIATLQNQVGGAKFNMALYCAGGTPPGTVDAATTAALPSFLYDSETGSGDQLVELGSFAALPAQDGVAMSVGKRLLVKNQTGAGSNGALSNGIYVLTQQGDGVSTPWILTRAPDAYTSAQLGGVECLVNGGTANGSTVWLLPVASSAIVVGTTGLNFVQVANALGQVTTQAASTYTLQPGDNNSTILFSSSAAVAVTLPNSLPVGFKAKLIQNGTGQVSVSAASGATLDTPNQSSTPGRYAALDCFVTANAGAAAVWDAIASAPPNVAASLVTESANYAALGSEGFIEVNASGGVVVITVAPSLANGRAPIRVRKIDTSANAVEISDGTNVVFSLVTAANSAGNGGGWCDVSSNGTNLRTEGVP